jgi:hypothetical protein
MVFILFGEKWLFGPFENLFLEREKVRWLEKMEVA